MYMKMITNTCVYANIQFRNTNYVQNHMLKAISTFVLYICSASVKSILVLNTCIYIPVYQ